MTLVHLALYLCSEKGRELESPPIGWLSAPQARGRVFMAAPGPTTMPTRPQPRAEGISSGAPFLSSIQLAGPSQRKVSYSTERHEQNPSVTGVGT